LYEDPILNLIDDEKIAPADTIKHNPMKKKFLEIFFTLYWSFGAKDTTNINSTIIPLI